MPGHIHRKAASASSAAPATYEAVAQLTEIGLGQSSAVGIGGDPINGLKHIDVMKAFNDDPDTDAVIMIGEIGGSDEADAARWCRTCASRSSASSRDEPPRPASGWATPAR